MYTVYIYKHLKHIFGDSSKPVTGHIFQGKSVAIEQ